MIKKFLLVLLCVVNMGCVSITAKPQTLEQSLYAIINDYNRLQELSIRYKDSCEEGLFSEDSGCEATVLELQKIDKQASNIIDTLKFRGNEVDFTKTMLTGLHLLTTQMSQKLVNDDEF